MVIVINEEDVDRVIRAYNLKRRIMELENEIGELQRKKAELEEEYANLGIEIQ